MATSTEEVKANDVVSLPSHKEKMLQREINKWGHISFRWEIQLSKGDYFYGPSGESYQVQSTGAIRKIKIKETESKRKNAIHIETFDSFWCEDSLFYASASSGFVNLQSMKMQGIVLYRIRQKRNKEKQKEEQQKNAKEPVIMSQRVYSPDYIDPYLIQPDK